jgi:alpha-tubulin suppressor-like RCC1 family protein
MAVVIASVTAIVVGAPEKGSAASLPCTNQSGQFDANGVYSLPQLNGAALLKGEVLVGGTGGVNVYANTADGPTAQPRATLTDCQQKDEPAGMAFDANGELLTSTFNGNNIERYNTTTGQQMSNFGVAPPVFTTLATETTPTTLTLASATSFFPGDTIVVGLATPRAEEATIASRSGNQITLTTPLTDQHNTGEAVEDTASKHTWYWCHPESIATDTKGDEFVGHADCLGYLLKFDKYGTFQAAYDLKDPLDNTNTRGTDWITFAPGDSCTLYWTSEGTSVNRFNVCPGGGPEDHFATGLKGPHAYALRVLSGPNTTGEVLVADSDRVELLSPSGAIIQEYRLPGSDVLYGLDVDPDNQTFWVSDTSTGQVARFPICGTGNNPSCDSNNAIDTPIQSFTIPAGQIGSPGTFGSGLLVVPATDIAATNIEVTQVIQNQDNTDRLIAGKQTYAIVRAQTTGADEPAPGVTATLSGVSSAGSFGPLKPLNGRVTLGGAPSRDRLSNSFLFALPPQWDTGSMHLEAVVNPSNDPMRYKANESDVSRDVTFSPPPEVQLPNGSSSDLHLAVVNLDYYTQISGTPHYVTTNASYEQIAGPVRRLYPLPDDSLRQYDGPNQVSQAPLELCPPGSASTCDPDPETATEACGRVLNFLISLRSQMRLPGNTILFGAMSGPPFDVNSPYGPDGPSGCSFTKASGYQSALVATGDPTNSTTIIHEIGHALGLNHTVSADLTCESLPPDQLAHDPYPDPNATIGLGWDHSVAHSDPATIVDEGLSQKSIQAGNLDDAVIDGSKDYDFMSYCPSNLGWMSDTRYEQLYGRGAPSASSPGIPSVDLGATPGVFDPDAPSLNAVSLSGSIDLTTEAASVEMGTGYQAGAFPAPPVGPYHLRLIDSTSATTADYPFEPAQAMGDETHESYPTPGGSFRLIVPLPAGTTQAEIYSDLSNKVIWSQSISPYRPTVTMTSPATGSTLPGTGPLTVSWNASDASGEPLEFSVMYSADGGSSWSPIANNLTTASTSIDAGQLTGANGNGIIRVIASDGVNAGSDEAQALTVPPKAPTVAIDAPTSGATFTAAQAVPLQGWASDPQDGSLSGAELTWTSNIDGVLGTGSLIVADGLSVGVHQITLTAVTSDGRTATATTQITVNPDTIPGPTLDVGPANITVPVSQFSATDNETVEIDNLGSGAPTWSAATDSTRISLNNTEGQTPGQLGFGVDTSGLLPGESFVAHITITADNAANSPQVVAVTGENNLLPATVTPTNLGYGRKLVSGTPTAKTVTFTNSGDAAVTLLNTSVTGPAAGDFTLTTDSCSNATVPAGGSCNAIVSFSPHAVGDRSAYLVLSDVNNSTRRWYVSLHGEGAPALQSASGTVYGWGQDTNQELPGSFQGACPAPPGSDIPTECLPAPVAIPSLSNVTQVSSSSDEFGSASDDVALKPDGTVWQWGFICSVNSTGGNTCFNGKTTPQQVQGLSNITSVAAGYEDLALDSNGNVWSWGHADCSSGLPGRIDGWAIQYDNSGQAYYSAYCNNFGNGADPHYNVTPGEVMAGAPCTSGFYPTPTACQTPLSNVVAIAEGVGQGGYWTAYALKSDGTVWMWGDLGPNNTTLLTGPVEVPGPNGSGALSGIIAISDGMALRSDGTVWTWGWGSTGQLGNGTQPSGWNSVPVEVLDPTGAKPLSGVTAIAGQRSERYALRNDGTVVAWGQDGAYSHGGNLLGVGSPVPALNSGCAGDCVVIPAPVVGPNGTGELTSVAAIAPDLALRSDGSVWAWGQGYWGSLGNGTSAGNPWTNSADSGASSPVQVQGPGGTGFLQSVGSIFSGDDARFAIGSTGGGPNPPLQPPTVVGTADRSPDQNGWYNHQVTITWSAPGAQTAACSPPTVYSHGDGSGIDLAGGCSLGTGVGSGTATLNYDDEPPTTVATLTGAQAPPGYDPPVTVSLQATDDLSGVASTFYTLDGNQTVYTYNGPIALTTSGYHEVQFWSQDNAGNVEPHNDSAHTLWILIMTGPLDHLGLNPPSTTIEAGSSQTYTADGYDSSDIDLGDATDSTVFTISPDGTCTRNVCTAATTGRHTITGTDDGKTGTAILNVIPGPLDHLAITPANAGVQIGNAQVYAAEGFDQYGNGLGDVTNATTFKIGPDGSCTGAACTPLSVGTHTITGNDSGKTGTATLSASPANLAVTAPSASATYGSPIPALPPGYSGFVNGDTAASLASPASCSTTAVLGSPPGSYPITCSGAVDPNYLLTYLSGTLSIIPAHLTVNGPTVSMNYGSAVPALTPAYSGFVNGDTAASLSSPASCTTTANSSSVPGTYPVTCSGAVDGDYTISYATGSVTVNQAPSTTVPSSSANPSATGQAVTYTATVSPSPGGGAVSFSDNGAQIAGCASQPVDSRGHATCTTTPSGLGPHNITASYSGDTDYKPSQGTMTQAVDLGLFNIIALDPSACKAFQSGGNGVAMNLASGGIFDNSNCTSATSGAWFQSGSSFTLNSSAKIDVVGSFNGGGTYTGPSPTTGVPAPPHNGDPLWNLTPPTAPTSPLIMGSGPATICPQTQGTFTPGEYNCRIQLTGPASFVSGAYNVTGGIVITANRATITFGSSTNPSQYTLGGVGLINSGSSDTVTATATFFYLAAGQWNLQGNSCICTLSPPSTNPKATTFDPAYGGITLFQARNDNTTVLYAGNQNGSTISGTMYVPDGQFKVTANSTASSALTVIADTFYMSAGGAFATTGPGYWVP